MLIHVSIPFEKLAFLRVFTDFGMSKFIFYIQANVSWTIFRIVLVMTLFSIFAQPSPSVAMRLLMLLTFNPTLHKISQLGCP